MSENAKKCNIPETGKTPETPNKIFQLTKKFRIAQCARTLPGSQYVIYGANSHTTSKKCEYHNERRKQMREKR